MYRKNEQNPVFLLLEIFVVTWLSEISEAENRVLDCFKKELSFNNAWIQGGIILTSYKIGNDVTCFNYCCKDPECDLSVVSKNFCNVVKCTKQHFCYVRPSKKQFSGSKVFIPRRSHIGLLQRVKSAPVTKHAVVRLDSLSTGIGLKSEENKRRLNSDRKKHNELYFRESINNWKLKKLTRTKTAQLEKAGKLEHGIKQLDGNYFSQFIAVPHCNIRPTLTDFVLSSWIYNRSHLHQLKANTWSDCTDLCCGDLLCDTALLVGKQCFLIHCAEESPCRQIKVSQKDTHYKKTKLGKVFRTYGNRLSLRRKMPSFLTVHFDEIAKEESSLGSLRHVQVSRKVTDSVPSYLLQLRRDTRAQNVSKCNYKVVLRNVRLKHGRKSVKFEPRGIVVSMSKCVEMCCRRRWCDVAFKVGRYCYSVHCPFEEACVPVRTKYSELSSDYVLLDKPPGINSKRDSIPGTEATQGEKKITIRLNITNEVFKEALKSDESLEFLNLAERVENAISLLLKNTRGFKGCEVTSFSPSPLVTNVTLIFTMQSTANVSGVVLLNALRAGRMDSTLEDASERFKLSESGFEMKTAKGHSLVCHAQENYDNQWSLTMYGASDRQPCPRSAQGESFRRCLGNENETVHWDVPNFSGCTSLEFKDLHEKAKLFKMQAEAKLSLDQIEAKAGIKHVEILKKLQQLTYRHTFRENLLHHAENATGVNKKWFLGSNKMGVNKSEKDVKTRGRDLLNLTNTLLSINHPRNPGDSITSKLKTRKNDTVEAKPSLADKSFRLQPNITILKSQDQEVASPGTYHVLNDSKPLRYPPVIHSNGQGRNGVSVSVSVSGELAGSDSSSKVTDPPGIFVKSSPENIRSRVPRPNPRRDRRPPPSGTDALSNWLNGGLPKTLGNPTSFKNVPQRKRLNRLASKASSFKHQPQLSYYGGLLGNVDGERGRTMHTQQYPRQHQSRNTQPQISLIGFPGTSNNAGFGFARAKRQLQGWNGKQPDGTQVPYNNNVQEQTRFDKPVEYSLPGYTSKEGQQSPENKQQAYSTQTEDRQSERTYTGGVRSDVDRPPGEYDDNRSPTASNSGKSKNSYLVGITDVHGSITKDEKESDSMSAQRDQWNEKHKQPEDLNTLSQSQNTSNTYSIPLSSIDSDPDQPSPSFPSSPGTPSDSLSGTPDDPPAVSTTVDPPASSINSSLLLSPYDSPTSTPSSNPPPSLSPPTGPPPPATSPPPSSPFSPVYPYDNYLPPAPASYPPSSPPPPPPPPYRYPPPPPALLGSPSAPSPSPPTSSTPYNPPEYPPISQSSSPDDIPTSSPPSNSSSYSSFNFESQSNHDSSSTSNSDTTYNQTVTSSLSPDNNIDKDPSFTSANHWQSYDDTTNNATYSDENTSSSEKNGTYAYSDESDISPTGGDFNMKTVGTLLNSANASWDKLSDYNMTTYALPPQHRENESKGEGNSKWSQLGENHDDLGNDYNITFQKLADNLLTESQDFSNITNSTKDSSTFSSNSYKDLLSGSQVIVGLTNQTSPLLKTKLNSSEDLEELGRIKNGVDPPHLTIDDMKKRIHEFTNNIDDKQSTGEKKTIMGEKDTVETKLMKGRHVAPMFGGDLLLAADTVKHLAKFNDYIRPAIVLEDVKAFVLACSNILDEMNSHEWKNAQKHVAKLHRNGLNIMNDGNAVDWEEASKRTLKDPPSPSKLYEMVQAIEAFGLSASYQLKTPITEPVITKNVVMEMRTVSSNIQEVSPNIVFPNMSDPRIRNWAKQANVITLSPASLDEIAQGPIAEIHVTGVLFKTIANLTIPVEEGPGNQSVTNGNLLSMTVYPYVNGELDPPIEVALAHSTPEMSRFKQDCVFLNATTSGGAIWSSKGCEVACVNGTHTICKCNHMSTYSVLVDKSRLNDFQLQSPTNSPVGQGGGGGSSGVTSFLNVALIFLLILALVIIITFVVWKKTRSKGNSEKDSKSSKSGQTSEDIENGTSGTTTTEGRNGSSSQSSSSRDKRHRGGKKKGEGRKEERRRKPKRPLIIDKDSTSGDNRGDRKSRDDGSRSSANRKERRQKERDEQLLIKEKAMIFSDYRQPYNFLSHEDASPVDSSTPLPGPSKMDTYPRGHKRPSSLQESTRLPDSAISLRKHNSEGARPLERLHRRRTDDSPRRRSILTSSQQDVREGSIQEETLEETQAEVAPDIVSPSVSQRASVLASEVGRVVAGREKPKKKKFWRRKSKDSLDLESIREGEPVTPDSSAEVDSPKKKKTFFGKKGRSASRTSLNATDEEVAATSALNSDQQIGDERNKGNKDLANEITEPRTPDTPTKKKRFWRRGKSGSQVSLGAIGGLTSAGQAQSSEFPEGDMTDEDGITGATKDPNEEMTDKPKRSSFLGRLSKSGSRSSLSKSDESIKAELVSTDDNPSPGSPKKRKSSLLGRLSKSGSRSSLSKSEESIGELGSVNDNSESLKKRRSSILQKLGKSGSRRSSKKSEDGRSGTSGQLEADEVKESDAGVADVSLGDQGSSGKSEKTKKDSFMRRVSQSGSISSLSKSAGDLAREGSISPHKKK